MLCHAPLLSGKSKYQNVGRDYERDERFSDCEEEGDLEETIHYEQPSAMAMKRTILCPRNTLANELCDKFLRIEHGNEITF